MKIGIAKETAPYETRVAISPDMVKKYISLGFSVTVEKGAGLASDMTDDALKDAGATLAAKPDEIYSKSDIVLAVQSPETAKIAKMKKGALLLAIMNPYKNDEAIKACAKAGVNAFAMELVPRISRAQSMDVLSSQSNLAGYKSVLDAAEHYVHAFPLMMTAAGTIPPAKVFVMGAGVAGLQAIATAKRLGAVVSATDVRMAAKEQVQSLGGTFVMVEDEETAAAETSGGYAKEMSAAYKKKQAALIAETIAKQDIVICTALIPGRPAPELVSEAMVKTMKKGSVIIDLAVEQGGNCPLSEPGKVVEKHGVKIVGHMNVPGRLAADASALYAKNLYNLLSLFVESADAVAGTAEQSRKKEAKLNIDWDDEIIQGVALTKGGKVVHPQFGKKADAVGRSTEQSPQSKKPAKKETAKKPAAKKATAKKAAVKKAPVKKKSGAKK